jgi:UDPglucose 6-dehydrogenase
MASIGHRVVGTDSDLEKIKALKDGVAPFYEPGLQDLLVQQLESGRLSFSSDMAETAEGAAAVFISVGTPPRASGEASLIAVENAAAQTVRVMTDRLVLVEKSTVPAGTSARLRRIIQRERPDLADEIEIASNPEFLREGRAIEDSLHPERILVGASAPWAFEVLRKVYEPITDQGVPLIETDVVTAELAKHASNAFLALKISYINAVAAICERAGADVAKVADVMGSDSRIGRSFLDAGIGYGGSCFSKDLMAFDHLSTKAGYDFPLLREIARINEEATGAIALKVKDALWNLEGKRVVILGLSFKPGTDDVRFAPALVVASALLAEGAQVVGWDPQAGENAKREVPDLDIAPDVETALTGAHCAIVCTEWPEVKALDLERVKPLMAYPIVIDGRNVFEPGRMAELGFTYYPTGRPVIT